MKKAAALKYEQGDKAPKVIGVGKGNIAEKIIEIAKEKKVPIIKNSVLAGELTELELGQEIPEELFAVVAEVLAFIYKTSKDLSHSK